MGVSIMCGLRLKERLSLKYFDGSFWTTFDASNASYARFHQLTAF